MSYLIRNKKTGVECWVEQETLDQITDLKMWGTFERINPTNSKKTDKPTEIPLEVLEFKPNHLKNEVQELIESKENKPKYKSKKK
jgi:hypothetical protein